MIFERIQPERVTLGTLRFEAGFYKNRHSIFTSGPELPRILESMQPMFEPKLMASGKESVGKYSFSEDAANRYIRFHHQGNQEIFRLPHCPMQRISKSLG